MWCSDLGSLAVGTLQQVINTRRVLRRGMLPGFLAGILAICPHARPVKQKVRKQALERQQFIAEEIKKLEAAGQVRGVLH